MFYIKTFIVLCGLLFLPSQTLAVSSGDIQKGLILETSKLLKEVQNGKVYFNQISTFYKDIEGNADEIIKIQQRLIPVYGVYQDKKIRSKNDAYTKVIIDYLYFKNLYILGNLGEDINTYVYVKNDELESSNESNTDNLQSYEISSKTKKVLERFPLWDKKIRSELNPKNIFPLGEYYVAKKAGIEGGYSGNETIPRIEIEGKDQWVSQNELAYYSTTIDIQEAGKYEFYTDISHSQASMIINGRELFSLDQNNASNITLELDPGKYTLEFIHKDTGYFYNYSFGYMKAVSTLSKTDIIEQKYAAKESGKDSAIWYVGVYESDNSEKNIYVELEQSDAPITLLLRSYESVNWKIINPSDTQIDAIYYSSYEAATTVSGQSFEVDLHKISLPGSVIYKLEEPKCEKIDSDSWKTYYCENDPDDLNAFKSSTESLWDIPRGFSGKYSTSEIKAPEIILDENKYKELESLYDKHKNIRKEYDTTGLY